MTIFQETKRRRQQSTSYSDKFSVIRKIRQYYLISTISILVVVMLRSPSSYVSRSSHLPFLNAFPQQNFRYSSSQSSPRPHLLRFYRYQSPNIQNNHYLNIRHRANDLRRQQTIMPAVQAAASSSAAEIIISQNETTCHNNDEYCFNGTSNQSEISPSPKMVQNDKIWDSYTETMKKIIRRECTERNRLAVLPEELIKVEELLLQNRVITEALPMDLLSESRREIRDRLNTQKKLFLQLTNLTLPMYDLYCRCLVYLYDYCARGQIRAPALPTWYKIRECGLYPRENSISTCLYVLSMQQSQVSVSTNTSSPQVEVDVEDVPFRNACMEVAIFHDLLYHSNEKTALVRIKGYIADHNVQAAEEVLATLQSKSEETRSQNFDDSMSHKRLRTYQPIFQYYCDTGNIIDAFRIYREMQKTTGVHLIAETYAMLFSSAARHGWFRKQDEMSKRVKSERSKAMKQLRFRYYCGPDLLDELFSEMSRDVLELDESCVAMIIEGFNVGFNYSQSTTSFARLGWISDISQWFQRFLRSPANTQLTGTMKNRRIFLERVSINNTTAICPSSGAKLRLLTLSKQQIRNVHDSLLQMAECEQEKFSEKGNYSNKSKNKKGKVTDVTSTRTTPNTPSMKSKDLDAKNRTLALKELSLFSDWLRYRSGDPYTAIIDGPNVAYYGHGDVRWCQVEQLLNKLEKMGENPLVIMPQKYISPKFYIASIDRTQKLSSSDLAFINKLVATKKMYVVPSGCLDDYYWMLSSVAEQKSGSNYVHQHVPTDDAMGRFPGLRPLLVTNDQMRDHRLALLEPRLFRRWASCHIVKYHIELMENSMNNDDRVTLFPADFFSREIQCNKASHLGNSTAWHIPIAEWPEPDRLCVSVIR